MLSQRIPTSRFVVAPAAWTAVTLALVWILDSLFPGTNVGFLIGLVIGVAQVSQRIGRRAKAWNRISLRHTRPTTNLGLSTLPIAQLESLLASRSRPSNSNHGKPESILQSNHAAIAFASASAAAAHMIAPAAAGCKPLLVAGH